ncbi:MAG: hypothetical protein R3A52_21910 [Polyangiales bacterium]
MLALAFAAVELRSLTALGDGPGLRATVDEVDAIRGRRRGAMGLVTVMVEVGGGRREQRALTLPVDVAARMQPGAETRVWEWRPLWGPSKLVPREDVARLRRENTLLLWGLALTGAVLLALGGLAARRWARDAKPAPAA